MQRYHRQILHQVDDMQFFVDMRLQQVFKDVPLLHFAEIGTHGQTDHLLGQLLRHGGAVGAAEVFVGRLFVKWHGVVHGTGDACFI